MKLTRVMLLVIVCCVLLFAIGTAVTVNGSPLIAPTTDLTPFESEDVDSTRRQPPERKPIPAPPPIDPTGA